MNHGGTAFKQLLDLAPKLTECVPLLDEKRRTLLIRAVRSLLNLSSFPVSVVLRFLEGSSLYTVWAL